MGNKRVPASRLMQFSTEDVSKRLKSSVTIMYSDGVEVLHTANELDVNRRVFGLLEGFDKLNIVSKYSIHNYYVKGQYVANTINKAFEAMLEDIVAVYVTPNRDRSCLGEVYKRMYLIMEDIYNNVVYEHLEYVSSLRITDFLDIQLKPELMAAIAEVRVKKDLKSVKNTYDVLDKVIRTSPALKNNPIAKGYVSGTVSADQVKQLLGSRGFVTEIDSSIFKYPIASSFVLGMDDMYDMAVESRSGAKALYLSNRVIQLAEYFARETQLVAMSVERLVDGDCGNKEYIEWVVVEGDFFKLLGKHYFDNNDVEQIITKESRDIIGTTIKMRGVSRCKLENPRHICTACFGELSASVPLHSNIGHISTTTVTAQVSQKILSTKHITSSASAGNIVLTDTCRTYFIVKNKDSYAFRANSINKGKSKYRLHIPQEQGFGLTSIEGSPDVNRLNLARVSVLSEVYLSIEATDGSVEEVPLTVNQGRRMGNFTYDFLSYVKECGYSIDHLDRIVVDLGNWPTGVPIICLPQIEFSYIDLAKAIKDELKSMKESPGTPEAFLHKMFNLVNAKLTVNVALLEVLVYAFTVMNPAVKDVRLGRNSETAEPTKMINIMTGRSVGGAYAWEHGMKVLTSPRSFYGNNNIDHPLDVMLRPGEVLADYDNKV